MTAPTRRLVLDTNIVLDCLVFCDPAMTALMTAIEARDVQPLVHDPSLDELRRVLAYPQCRLDERAQRSVLERYVAIATLATMPAGFDRNSLLLPPDFPRCRDLDDQPFLALAYHAGADALVTRDKALLKLRRRARRFNVTLLTPAQLQFP
jgi:putative PIN family toxin of toxin-antitoxin system